MLLESYSPDERQKFLLLFTLQLIINSGSKIDELEQIIKTETKKEIPLVSRSPRREIPEHRENAEKPRSPQPQQPVPEKDKMMKSVLSQNKNFQKRREASVVKPVHLNSPRMEIQSYPRSRAQTLRVPEPRLPPEFQYLRPVPAAGNVDLGKINPLIYDRAVITIECSGPDHPLIVTGSMGRKQTNIILSNEEVEDTIKRFSEESKIPYNTGVYKVAVGGLIFSAVISDVVPSRFMIRKMYTAAPPSHRNLNPNYRLFFRNNR